MAQTVVKHSIIIDVAEPNWNERLYVVQGTDNEITMTIQKAGETVDLTDIGTVVLVSQPSRKGSMPVPTKAEIVDAKGGVAVVKLARRAVEYVGIVKSQLKMYGKELAGQISSTAYEIEVEESTDQSYQPPADEMSFIEQNMADTEAAQEGAEQAAQSALSARDRLTGEVGQAIKTLNTEKTAKIGEMDAAVEALNTDKTAALQEMQTKTDDTISTLNAEKTEAIDQMEEVREANRTKFLPAVATVAERDSKYPEPVHGDTVRVTDTATMYRYVDGSGWVVTDQYQPTAIDQVNQQLAETDAKALYTF